MNGWILNVIHNINKNHKIRLLSKPNTVNKTYQLQSTPTGNFNPPLATEKEEQRNRRRKRKGFVNFGLRTTAQGHLQSI
ncbi:hypothetical protein Avbf_16582 [Armadillidium vulgare]|nr:hypothetical protein Avbf_16582 [Armadillidium vulgare]